MPTVTVAAPSQTLPMRRRFTVDEYFALAEAGILHKDERVELIDGEIIIMSPISHPHRQSVNWAGRLLNAAVGERAMVQVQAPIELDDSSAPQPGIAVLRLRPVSDFTPVMPDEVYFLVEVADSSLAFDRGTKLARYAAAGIPEVWIANLVNRQIEAYSNPVDGVYQNLLIGHAGATISPQAFPDVTLAVNDFLPG